MMKRLFLLSPLLLGGLLGGNLWAIPISGTFDFNALFEVSATDISWFSDDGGNIPERFSLNGGSGSFGIIPDGFQATVRDLNIGAQPVGVPIPPFTLQEFGAFAIPFLQLTFIHEGVFSDAQCALPAAVGQVCTPTLPGNKSPFSLINLGGGQSSASIVFSGITADGDNVWTATLTSQFGSPYQDLLAIIAGGGSSPRNAISGLVTVTPIPEPGTFALFGTVLLLAPVAFKRLKK